VCAPGTEVGEDPLLSESALAARQMTGD